MISEAQGWVWRVGAARLSLLHEEQLDLSDDRDLAAQDAALLQVTRHGLLELEPHLAVGRGAAVHDLGGEGLAELLGRRSLGELGQPLEGLALDAHHAVRAVELRAVRRGQSILRQPELERLDLFERDGLLLRHAPSVAVCVEDRTKADGHLLLLEGHANVYLPVRVVRRVRHLSVLHGQLLLVRSWPTSHRVAQPLVAPQGHGFGDGFASAGFVRECNGLHDVMTVHTVWMAVVALPSPTLTRCGGRCVAAPPAPRAGATARPPCWFPTSLSVRYVSARYVSAENTFPGF